MHMRTIAKDTSRRSLLTGILLVGAWLRFYDLAGESLWFDEAYSVWVARHSVSWHLQLSTQRIFPPLYYVLLHFWLRLGDSEYVVRTLSVLVGVISIALLFRLSAELFDEVSGLFSALLMTISPLHVWYSQEARMYITVAALGLSSALFLIMALRHRRLAPWLGYTLSIALAMNAHYFAVFFLPFHALYVLYLLGNHLLSTKKLWFWIVSQVGAAALSVVGLAGVFSAESDYWWGLLDTWHGAPGVSELLDLAYAYSLGTTVQGRALYWVGLLVFGVCGLAGLSQLLPVGRYSRVSVQEESRGVRNSILFAALYLAVPLLTVFTLSQFRSFWVLRYIFPFLPPYCILVARGILRFPWRLRIVAIGVVLLLTLWPIVNTYRYQQKENWRSAVAYISAQEEAGDAILLVDEDVWLPFEHYYRGPASRSGISRSVIDRQLVSARIGLLASVHQRIWLVVSHSDNWLVRDCLVASKYASLVVQEDFGGVYVALFDIDRGSPLAGYLSDEVICGLTEAAI